MSRLSAMKLSRHCYTVAGLLLGLAVGVGADPRSDLMDAVTVLRGADDFAAAAAHLQTWITRYPGDGEARLLLGQVLADSGDNAAALRVWTGLLRGRDVDVDRYRDVAKRLQDLGLVEAATQILREGTERLGDGDPFAWQRAELLISMGDWAGAVEAHRAFLRQEPHRQPLVENLVAAIARADVAAGTGPSAGTGVAERGRATRYCAALKAAVAKSRGPEHTRLTLLLSSCSLQTGDAAAGLQALLGAVDGNGDSNGDDAIVQALFQYARRCETAGHADVAARAYGLFAQRAEGSPYHARARLKRAEMLALAGDVDGALAGYLELSSGGDTAAVEALLYVARLQAQTLGDPAAALSTLAVLGDNALAPGVNALANRGVGVSYDELQRRLLSLRADCRVRLDDLEGAAAEWRLLAADPAGLGAAEFGLAEVAFFAARFDTAAAHIDSLVLQHPSHPLANDALALLLLIDEFGSEGSALAVLARARLRERQGRTDEAERDRAWLMTEAPVGLRHLSLLETAARMENVVPAQALELYKQVTGDDPEERHAVSAAMGRARLLEAMGRVDEALRTYETTVLTAPLDSRTPDIRRHITRLRSLSGGTG